MSSKLTLSPALVLLLVFFARPGLAQTVVYGSPFGVPIANVVYAPPTPSGFAVYVKGDASSNNIAASVNTLPAEDGKFPNLETLFRFGGTIELALRVGSFASLQGQPLVIRTDTGEPVRPYTIMTDADTEKDITATEAAKYKHWAIITEIMWGLDLSKTGSAQSLSQWIEIFGNYNLIRHRDSLRLRFIPNQTVDNLGKAVHYDLNGDGIIDEGETYVVVDRVSTVNRFGLPWEQIPGSSGRLPSVPGQRDTSYLVSMYRKRRLTGANRYYSFRMPFGDGSDADSWAASVGRTNIHGYFIGTPGAVHKLYVGTATRSDKTPASLPGTGLIINEIRDDTSAANLDWIELYNNSSETINIRNWEVQVYNSYYPGTFVYFFSDKNINIPAGEYFVIYSRHPEDTIFAGGVNVEDDDINHLPKGAMHLYYVARQPLMPTSRNFLIVLNRPFQPDGNIRDIATERAERVVDIAGNMFLEGVDILGGEYIGVDTDIWPLKGWTKPSGDNLSPLFTEEEASNFAGYTWARTGSRSERFHKDDWEKTGYKGGIGYDPDTDPALAIGTPGYANDTPVNLVSDDKDNSDTTDDAIFDGTITISEIMVDAGPRWNLVQWIELYNNSMTQAVNLDGWELEIYNKADVESYIDSSFTFRDGAAVLPNQTLLLVSGSGNNDVPSNRVYNLYQHHRRELGLLRRNSVLLSRTGFYLKLIGKKMQGGREIDVVIDEAGNIKIDGAKRTMMWKLPPLDSTARQSLVRQYGSRVIDGDGPDDAENGTIASSWRRSDIVGAGLSFYGHRNDVSTPGFRLGGPLPVSLSNFRPVCNQITGHVDITWITQSELDNAGFNILRSESKDSKFKVINLKGIVPGHGTTSETHVYTFTDTTTKPNVAYYYQIEEVSLDGQRTTLYTTHLRGNVKAGGKLTTTWSDLKSDH